ncbi:MAG: glycosyltransferase family 39 protein [Candidatus Tectomicrobia bacterium]|uniref:Glycosyltransferase family 39 protein n=1 Tax=Tectimicrobiota bacterium TaxID=2528274 RepID=A0A932I1R9_UNCTE|nr:glycosyltransferase family 39 protein [Candidatus Tectomicrobia bacterium]
MAGGPAPGAPARPVPAWIPLALLAIPVLLVWINLGGGAAKLPVEARSREIIQTMARTGDWLVPRVDGKPFLSKPPLYHWIGAISARIRGEADWWSARVPSAIGAMVMLAVTVAWGTALGGPALGGLAGLLTGMMALFLIMARRGSPDMAFSAACVAALYLFERLWHGRRRNLLPAFGLSLALAALAKGTTLLPVVGIPAALALTLRRGWGRVFRREVLMWLAAAALAGGSWYLLVFVQMPKEAIHWALLEGLQPVGVEVVGHTGRHFRAFWYYLYRIWDIAIPVSVLLPLTARHVWRAGRWRGRGGWAFVVWTFVVVLVFFSVLPAKQPHYLLPVLPLLGLMAADALLAHIDDPPGSLGEKFLTSSQAVLLVLLAAGTLLGLGFTLFIAPSWLAGLSVLGGVGALVLTGRGWMARRRREAWLGAVAAAGCLGLLYFGAFEEWKSLDRQADRAEAQSQAPEKPAAPIPPGGGAKKP